MIALRAFLCVLLLASAAHAQSVGNFVQGSFGSAATVQVLTATTTAVASGAAARNMSFTYDMAATGSSGQLTTPFPSAGTLSNLRFRVIGGVTGSQTWQGEIVKNGSTNVIGCTVNASTNPCVQATSGSVAANDTAILVATPTGTPTNAILQVTVDFTPTNAGDTLLPAGNPGSAPFSTSTAQAMAPISSFNPGAVASRELTLLPEAGTVDLLTIATTAPGTGSEQYAWNANQNGTASTVTCTIVATATSCQDTTHSFTNVDGDNIEYAGTPSNTPATGAIGSFSTRWRSSVLTSDFPFLANGLDVADSATVTTFYSLAGFGSATEADAQSLVNNMTVTKIEVKLSAAPGAGKSRVFTLDDNTTPTALTCTISGASTTTCNLTGSISVAAGDLLDVSDAPSGSPSAVHPIISLVAHR